MLEEKVLSLDIKYWGALPKKCISVIHSFGVFLYLVSNFLVLLTHFQDHGRGHFLSKGGAFMTLCKNSLQFPVYYLSEIEYQNENHDVSLIHYV